jgi:hypothetical protein
MIFVVDMIKVVSHSKMTSCSCSFQARDNEPGVEVEVKFLVLRSNEPCAVIAGSQPGVN